MSMGHLDWDDGYRLGIPAIDAEHERLVARLDLFLDASMHDHLDAELSRLLADLIDATRAHFLHEEDMLDRAGYEDLPAHRAEHDRLLADLGHYEMACAAGEVPRKLSIETADYLRHWLLDHIRNADRQYLPFLRRLT
ncbi:MAG: hemerythrin family protein [Alphaproteobacteria bacterium]|nr:hemerythrin family protein [Alphaproteobacteria bacterium]MBF0371944.1 hemerythrin family protein [Alphaproteobacteria bacterium]MBF0392708.1 hemerythrin family protein [Alphaproteobacteria bacterium]